MTRYILQRMAGGLAVLLINVVLIFTLMYFVPGDPVAQMMGEGASLHDIQMMREKMGLDDPFLVRLGRYLQGFVKGDLGTSYRSKRPVFSEILARYPTTLKVAFGCTLLGLLIGVPAGVYSAVSQYSWLDRVFTSISLFGASAPSFWIAMLLVLVFSLRLEWLPATGSHGFRYWVLPVFTMGLQTSASIMRMTRSSMLEVIRQDYIRTARAKGQTEFKVVVNHGLRNALVPIMTMAGIRLSAFLGGAVLIETVFALPGLGKYVLDSVSFHDYPVVQGVIVWICVNAVAVTLLVDLLYGLVDPRIRTMYGAPSRRNTAKSK